MNSITNVTDGSSFMSKINYECLDGHIRENGSLQRECLANETHAFWTGLPFVCKSMFSFWCDCLKAKNLIGCDYSAKQLIGINLMKEATIDCSFKFHIFKYMFAGYFSVIWHIELKRRISAFENFDKGEAPDTMLKHQTGGTIFVSLKMIPSIHDQNFSQVCFHCSRGFHCPKTGDKKDLTKTLITFSKMYLVVKNFVV